MAWAELFAELRVDKSKLKDDVEKGLGGVDGGPAGKKMGTQFGSALGKETQARMRDVHGRFVADSGTAGDKAGSAAGSAFAAAFSKLTAGIFDRAGGGGSTAGALAGKTAAGAGPNILGLNLLSKGGAIAGAGVTGLAALPALAGGLGALGVAGAGAGVLGAGFGAVQSQISPLTQKRTQAQAAVAGATTPAQAQAAQAKLAAANAEIAKLSPALQSIIASEDKIKATWEAFAKSLAPLFAGPLAQVARLFTQLTGPLHQLFSGAATLAQPLIAGLGNLATQVLPLLGAAFRAVAPLLKPLLDGFTGLLTGLLPGLITLLRAAGPAVAVLAGFLAQLGSGLGGMFAQFAPVIRASSVVLKALFDVVAGLFPVIGSLAATLATALAPAFTVFAGVIRSLLPFLTIIGRLIGALAAAVLGDLSAAFGAVASLLRAIAPALTAFAGAISGVFTVLENSGVFAIIGNALEALAVPLGKLISAILNGLTPLLPPLIGFVSRLAAVFTAGLSAAIAALLPPLTQLATTALGTLAVILPVILPLLTTLASIFTAAAVGAIRAVAVALSAIVTAVPPGVLQAVVIGVLGVVGAFKAWAAIEGIIAGVKAAMGLMSLSMLRFQAQIAVALVKEVAARVAASAVIIGTFIAQAAAATAAYIAENLATLGIIAGITLLVAAIVYLATHWRQVWGEVKRIAADVWHFIWDGFGKFLLPLLGPVGLIALGVIELAKHWTTIWNAIKATAVAVWAAISGALTTAWHAIASFFTTIWAAITRTFTAALTAIKTALSAAWAAVTAAARAAWNAIAAFFTAWWNAEKAGVTAALNVIKAALGAAWAAISSTARTAWAAIASFFTAWWAGLRGSFSAAVNGIASMLSAAWNGIKNTAIAAFQAAVTGIKAVWNGIKEAVRVPVHFVVYTVLNGIIKAFDWITSHVGLGSPIKPISIPGLAAGGRITAGTGPTADDVLVRVSRDETVVSAEDSKILAPAFAALGIRGYAKGGKVGQSPPPVNLHTGAGPPPTGAPGFISKILDVGKIIAAATTGNAAALTNAFSDLLGARAPGLAGGGALASILTAIPKLLVKDLVSWIIGKAAVSGDGGAIANYAMTFLGKIPYVWGGTAVPGGADCSGFVQAIYKHFGIQAPRTSEAQGAWVKRGPPVPGGLAFYHSPPGGPDPGHVAIVRSAAQVISQGGGMGPDLISLHALPLLWTGVPPGGLGKAGGGGATPGTMTAAAIAALWKSLGGPAWAAANMARIAFAESGDRPGAIQQGQPPGRTGWGLYQITPTSGINQNGAFGNLLNASNNTRAAISLFARSGYGPWASDPVGRGLAAAPFGFARGGWINEPVTGVGRYSRALYEFGEAGRELVIPEGQARGGGDGSALLARRLDRIADLLEAAPARTGRHVGAAVNDGAAAAAFRARYPAGGI